MAALSGGDYEKAAEHFKQATADKPKDMWAFYYFGLCLLKLKRFDEATKAYQQAMLISPSAAAVHYQLGKIYLETGDLERARKEHNWLQEQNQELALYLSDPLQPEKLATQQTQEAPASSAYPKPTTEPMTKDLRPTILYREKAKYTEIARTNLLQGTVALQVVFDRNGEIHDIHVIRGLPDGLTHKAIEAARKIKFNPALKNGEQVSVRGSLEYTFNLY